jgi:hypothetical protein
MGNSLTEIEAYAQAVASFSSAMSSGFQAISSTFPALLANFQALLGQVQTGMQSAGSTSKPARLAPDLSRPWSTHRSRFPSRLTERPAPRRTRPYGLFRGSVVPLPTSTSRQ